jgi:hypothetical protein
VILGLVITAPARAEAVSSQVASDTNYSMAGWTGSGEEAEFAVSGTGYSAGDWSGVAIGILVTNGKIIARCAGTGALLGYSALRLLRANALWEKIVDIASISQGLVTPSCAATFEAAIAALQVMRIGLLDGSDFTFRDDSYVVDRRFAPNECHLDMTVGDATGRTWRYTASYRLCSVDTYGRATSS